MTEEEAREKECCANLSWTKEILDYSQSATPMVAGYETSTKCIASDCMAWRWYKDNRAECGHDEIDAPERGYCGLAGKP